MSDNLFAIRVAEECNKIHSKIGLLDELLTTNKDNTVAAINEVYSAAMEISNNLEEISSLVNEYIPRVEDNESKISNLQAIVLSLRADLDKVEAKAEELESRLDEIINDEQADTEHVYSSQKVEDLVSDSIQKVKDDLLGGAGDAYDTLKELAELIIENQDAIQALENIAAGHVKFDEAQNLSAEQQTQARDNIGAASSTLVDMHTKLLETIGDAYDDVVKELSYRVRYDKDQALSDEEQLQARTNIGAGDSATVDALVKSAAAASQAITELQELEAQHVAFVPQELTTDEKTQARDNIGAAAKATMSNVLDRLTEAENNISGLENESSQHVKFTAQNLDEDEKTTARDNIGAADASNVTLMAQELSQLEDTVDTIKVSASNAVQYIYQDLSDSEQKRARDNINAASGDDITNINSLISEINEDLKKLDILADEAVSYAHVQELTENEKTLARNNIGAVSQTDFDSLKTLVESGTGSGSGSGSGTTGSNAVTSISANGFDCTYTTASGGVYSFSVDIGLSHDFVNDFEEYLVEA